MRQSKARSDSHHLKEQREEKLRKEELLLELNLEKSREKFVETIIYCDEHAKGDLWKIVEDANEDLDTIKGTIAK